MNKFKILFLNISFFIKTYINFEKKKYKFIKVMKIISK